MLLSTRSVSYRLCHCVWCVEIYCTCVSSSLDIGLNHVVSFAWRKVCPQCSAVVSVRMLCCDLPYKRNVQIPDDRKDTMYSDSMSKRAKRASESHKQIVTRQKQNRKCMANLRSSETRAQTLQRQADNRKHMVGLTDSVWRRSVSVNSAISTFHSVVKLGPFVWTCCHHLMYRKSVVLCNKAHYTKVDADLFNNVFSADISYISCDGTEWVGKTCDKALKRGNMPLQAKANGLRLSQVPPELSNLNALVLRLRLSSSAFYEMVALPWWKSHRWLITTFKYSIAYHDVIIAHMQSQCCYLKMHVCNIVQFTTV